MRGIQTYVSSETHKDIANLCKHYRVTMKYFVAALLEWAAEQGHEGIDRSGIKLPKWPEDSPE